MEEFSKAPSNSPDRNGNAFNYETTRHLSKGERYAIGKQLRTYCPRSSHAEWKAPQGRPDPVSLIEQSDKGRLQDLVPLRHGRMAKSPFTFYRGAALNMASDLASTPVTGIRVQACGDAHLCNFGGFATPERNIIFAINDLDETLQAPWEWDLKRLAASFVVACRNNDLSDRIAREAVMQCVRSYREHMAGFSGMRTMELWHYSLGAEKLIGNLKDPELRKKAMERVTKERNRSLSEEIFPTITKGEGATKFIKDELPVIFHWEGFTPGQVAIEVQNAFELYRKSLVPSNSFLLDRYEIKDVAIKVVGVGSVGTACWILLLGTGDGETLFLQAKEARSSVLEPFAGKSTFSNHGQRIVNGYRLIQPFSDPFLGWTAGKLGRHYFFRQLRDVKISLKVESFGKNKMITCADWCGQSLALSHARSGDAAMLSGYMGKSDILDVAIASFATTYADQNEKDFALLKKAIDQGRLKAVVEES